MLIYRLWPGAGVFSPAPAPSKKSGSARLHTNSRDLRFKPFYGHTSGGIWFWPDTGSGLAG